MIRNIHIYLFNLICAIRITSGILPLNTTTLVDNVTIIFILYFYYYCFYCFCTYYYYCSYSFLIAALIFYLTVHLLL